MDSVKEHMDTGMGLLINTPGLPAEKANNLPAGYSENGGIFCQANCWAIIAEALLGRGDHAWKYYKQLIPHEVIKRIGVENYKGNLMRIPAQCLDRTTGSLVRPASHR